MTEWIDFSVAKPKEPCLCWVMNSRKGAHGFVALWKEKAQYFEYQMGSSHLNPALDVTHWFPLPIPFFEKLPDIKLMRYSDYLSSKNEEE